ncbi:hypothetical protein BC938DRAFT_474963 [Jimgerdemannia flammicorona]|uniref:TVP38/TMEM64 family membrane protein n=1 Tax=Jimgerdemannia flammicorona TaxID=994334 RepID=A0A433Q1E1_9FUNG|nr:hypothetical protein BC938DRAFT_474963 [Jimgerdemannia flammicorona]
MHSGANDEIKFSAHNVFFSRTPGLGFPFLFLAIYLIQMETTGVAIGKWIYQICLYQIVLSIVIGMVIGYVARKILKYAEKK